MTSPTPSPFARYAAILLVLLASLLVVPGLATAQLAPTSAADRLPEQVSFEEEGHAILDLATLDEIRLRGGEVLREASERHRSPTRAAVTFSEPLPIERASALLAQVEVGQITVFARTEAGELTVEDHRPGQSELGQMLRAADEGEIELLGVAAALVVGTPDTLYALHDTPGVYLVEPNLEASTTFEQGAVEASAMGEGSTILEASASGKAEARAEWVAEVPEDAIYHLAWEVWCASPRSTAADCVTC